MQANLYARGNHYHAALRIPTFKIAILKFTFYTV